MNTPLTLEWIQKVLGSFSFNQGLLTWDSYECHMEQTVSKDLKDKKIESLIIPGAVQSIFRLLMFHGTSLLKLG